MKDVTATILLFTTLFCAPSVFCWECDETPRACLQKAVRENEVGAARYYLEKGVEFPPNGRSKTGLVVYSGMHSDILNPIKSEKYDLVRLLLEYEKVDFEPRNVVGEILSCGDIKMVQIFLEYGMIEKTSKNLIKEYLMWLPYSRVRRDVVNLLLEYGEEVDGPEALFHLCDHGYVDIVERLLEDGLPLHYFFKKIPSNTRFYFDSERKSAFFMLSAREFSDKVLDAAIAELNEAARYNDVKLVKLYFENDCPFKSFKDELHMNLLHWAAFGNSLDVVNYCLTESGSWGWGKASETGDTPLHIAARFGHDKILEAFFDKIYWKSLLYEENNVGETPYELIKNNPDLDLNKLLDNWGWKDEL